MRGGTHNDRTASKRTGEFTLSRWRYKIVVLAGAALLICACRGPSRRYIHAYEVVCPTAKLERELSTGSPNVNDKTYFAEHGCESYRSSAPIAISHDLGDVAQFNNAGKIWWVEDTWLFDSCAQAGYSAADGCTAK